MPKKKVVPIPVVTPAGEITFADDEGTVITRPIEFADNEGTTIVASPELKKLSDARDRMMVESQLNRQMAIRDKLLKERVNPVTEEEKLERMMMLRDALLRQRTGTRPPPMTAQEFLNATSRGARAQRAEAR